ncbi:hypothetical protein Q4591_02080 [Shewanella sp. 3_MG-2023]|uniref:DUF6795 domain-containing protein n=1 Tax=Shewanella sp. 3_MG-2023 TaxID=3062635 RepID=UPI0026E2695F|nr:DUF6795 domain-containing protein [Shewanella sp. 3_MG-2023]MDO6774128.1 hypothetical protein [Shewanella sp. 3_MG-2023]
MFKKVDVEVFPEVSGSLSHNGQPLASIKLKRGYKYSGVMEQIEWDFTTTDDEGKFSFPEILYRTSHPNKPFAETRVAQAIKIAEGDFTDTFLWSSVNIGEKHLALLVERLAQLDCDLTNDAINQEIIEEEISHGVSRLQVFSICRWPQFEAIEVEKRKKYGE